MEVYLMRHGPAEDESSSGQDWDRALSGPGRKRVRDVANHLAGALGGPVRIITSPRVRALQTAEILAAALAPKGLDASVEISRALAGEGSLKRAVVQAVASRGLPAFWVGHEPDLSGLIFELCRQPLRVKKGMVIALRFEELVPSVAWMLDPKTLETATIDDLTDNATG